MPIRIRVIPRSHTSQSAQHGFPTDAHAPAYRCTFVDCTNGRKQNCTNYLSLN